MALTLRVGAWHGVSVGNVDSRVLGWLWSSTATILAGAACSISGGLSEGDGADLGRRKRGCGAIVRDNLARSAGRDSLSDDRGGNRDGVGWHWSCWRADSRWRSDWDVLGAVGDNTRVLWNEGSADTLEVRQSLGDDSRVSTMSAHALDDVLGEIGILAEAGEVAVVLAAGLLDPSVQALGQNSWAVVVWRRRWWSARS